MNAVAPAIPDQEKIDAGHLRLLGIFHFVYAGLSLLGIGFLILHRILMQKFMTPEMWGNTKNGPPPEQVMEMMFWFYSVFGTLFVVVALANAISGWGILKRRFRVFSLIVAGFNAISFPIGTTLSVFTFIVLLRESVVQLYRRSA